MTTTPGLKSLPTATLTRYKNGTAFLETSIPGVAFCGPENWVRKMAYIYGCYEFTVSEAVEA